MFIWQKLHEDGISPADAALISKRITAVCESWIGTPYMPGQRCKGIGSDCVQFVCGAMDDLNRREPGSTIITRLSSDTGANDHDGAYLEKVSRQIAVLNPSRKLKVFCLQPGDIVVCKLGRGGGGGHIMIVSGNKNVLYHACNGERKITKKGFGSIENGLHAYRLLNRGDWL